MKEFIEIFGGVTVSQLVTLLVAIGFIGGIYIKYKPKMEAAYEKKRRNDKILDTYEQKHQELVDKHNEDISKASERDQELKESIQAISQKIDVLSTMMVELQQNNDERFNAMSEKNDISERAKLKDRIAQSYRYHHEHQEWTRMDQEAFRGLIADYENHGGENSFVHDICEPESYTWKLLDD